MKPAIERISGLPRQAAVQPLPLTSAPARASAQMLELPELPDLADASRSPAQSVAAGPAVIADAVHPLHRVKTVVQVCVGQARVSVGELLGAREHHVVVLDRQVDQAVDLLVEGRVVARGHLIAVGEQFAVRITELPVPLVP